MDFLKTAFTMASNAAQQYYENYTKQQKLREQLKNCTYTDDVKFVIEKAVKQVFNVYPNFTTQILEFPEKGQMKRFLQLKSALDIEIRGNTQKVDYNMMLPVNYPKKPPYVRIVNQQPNSTIVQNSYISLRSPTDPKSFLLNQRLTQCKNWNQTKSIVNIIIQSHNMLRQKFPFIKQQNNSGMSQNQNWNNQGFNNNQNYNQYGGNNSGNFGFMPSQNTNTYNTANKKPPIPFVTTNLNQMLANGQNFAGSSKKIIEKLKTQHLKSVEKIQFLETVQLSLQSEEQYLRSQNMKIINFLQKSQTSSIRDISSLIRPRDQRSEQTLDLVSSIRAKQDCLVFLQSKFSQNQISYQQFIKHARKIEQQKFEEKFLLIKCIQKSK